LNAFYGTEGLFLVVGNKLFGFDSGEGLQGNGSHAVGKSVDRFWQPRKVVSIGGYIEMHVIDIGKRCGFVVCVGSGYLGFKGKQFHECATNSGRSTDYYKLYHGGVTSWGWEWFLGIAGIG
jgi:hypothetical protein